MAKPQIGSDLHMDSTWLGAIDFVFLLCYAIGNFISGTIGDRVSPSAVASIGVGIGGIIYLICILLGSLNFRNPWIYVVLFALEGTFQSAAWPATVNIMANWFPKANTGKIIGFWSSNAAAGHLIGAQISAALLHYEVSWEIIMGVSAVFMIVVALIIWVFGKDKPEESEVSEPLLSNTKNEEVHKKRISFWQAWLLPGVISYSLSFACVKTLNYAFLMWLPYYLDDKYQIESHYIGIMANIYDAASLVGVFMFGWMTDKLGNRGPTLCFIMLSTLPIIWGFQAVPYDVWELFFVLTFLIGLFVGSAGQLIPGAVAIDIGRNENDSTSEKALSTVAGIIDGTGSFGAAFGQILIGYLASFDWTYSFLFMLAASAVSLMLLLPIGYRECRSSGVTKS